MLHDVLCCTGLGYLERFTCNSTIYSGFKSRKIQYLSRSHYPREHKWGTSFRALSQLHKWGVKCSFVWGIDHVKQAQNCYRYSHCRSIYCSNQRFREVYKVSYKFPVMKGMFGIIVNNRCNISNANLHKAYMLYNCHRFQGKFLVISVSYTNPLSFLHLLMLS